MSNSKDVTTVQPFTTFSAHNKYLIRCLLSPDVKHFATCSADTTVKIWSTDGTTFSLETTLEGHQRWVWDCAFSADSAYLVTGIVTFGAADGSVVGSCCETVGVEFWEDDSAVLGTP
jgi:WD40 repeat protein